MRPSRALLLALLLWFGQPCEATGQEANAPAIRGQVDPKADLTALYPEAGHIGLAVAIVPDPHVPRYRRLFDLEVQAIQLGMLNDGYVLDRYAFASETDAQAFGLLIFRCDGWRGYPCQNESTLAMKPAAEIAATTRIRP